METLKNYLESMFASLPNTPEVLKAKEELFGMMEDKYNELISEGRPENEAVGIVISEFGNLDEVAESIGIGQMLQTYTYVDRNQVTLEEAEEYVQTYSQYRFRLGLGIMLLIFSPISFLLTAPVNMEMIGIVLFFGLIAVGVGVIIHSSIGMNRWKYLDEQLCTIDYATANQLKMEKEANRSDKALLLTIGIALCIMSVAPVALFESLFKSLVITEGIGPSILFLFDGIGVMMIIYSGGRESAINKLLGVNDSKTVSGTYRKGQDLPEKYVTPAIEAFMGSYWKIVTCVYLIWSFLTFDWYITWIIYPIAGVVRSVIQSIWGEKEE